MTAALPLGLSTSGLAISLPLLTAAVVLLAVSVVRDVVRR